MESKSVRQSNIELLRIVAILMVMVAHFNGFMAEGKTPKITAGADAVVICRNLISSFASICVVLFVLISGWFSIKPNLKKVVTLWTQIFFIYICLFVAHTIVEGGGVNIKVLISCFLPFTLGNWFVRSYLILMLLAPALNYFTKDLSQRGFLLFLAVFTVVALLYGCMFPSEAAGFNGGMSALSFVYIYVVGRYLRGFVNTNRSKWFWFCGYIILSLLIFLGKVIHLPWILSYCNPILILSAVSLFMFFVKLDIGYNRFVNWTASSAFAAFILHTQAPALGWLTNLNLHLLHTRPYVVYLGLIFVVIIAVFMTAILLDKIREVIFLPVIDLAGRIIISTEKNDKLIKIIKK